MSAPRPPSRRRGVLLAGGRGTRLAPLTTAVSKQLLPVYDKPMIFYPLSALMLAGIREILVVTNPDDHAQFRRLLGDGSQWGVALSYAVQPSPDGIAQALILGEDFLDGGPCALVLGDNIFFGEGLGGQLRAADARAAGASVFAYHVTDPERYGVVAFDAAGRATHIEEKPARPRSPYAVTGLYFYDARAPAFARDLAPSARGELEITDLNARYLAEGDLHVQRMGRGYAWLDAGTPDSLLQAGEFVRTVQLRQGLHIGCLEEIAFRAGWIDASDLEAAAARMGGHDYAAYLRRVAGEAREPAR